MRFFTLFLGAVGGFSVLAALNAAPAQALLDGSRLAEWEFVNPEKVPLSSVVQVATDGTIAAAGKPVGYLQTRANYDNYELHVEWRWTGKPGNGGILLHIDSGPIDRNTWPRCLQVQTKHTRAGDLLPMAGATFAEPLTTLPDAKTPQLDRKAASSEKPAGEWNACDIVCRDGTVEVRVNGVPQNRVTGCVPASGRIGIQFEGTAFELRSVRLTNLPRT